MQTMKKVEVLLNDNHTCLIDSAEKEHVLLYELQPLSNNLASEIYLAQA